MTKIQLNGYGYRHGPPADSLTESSRDTPLPSIEDREEQFVFSGSDSVAAKSEFSFRASLSASVSPMDEREPAAANFTRLPNKDNIQQSDVRNFGDISAKLNSLQLMDCTPAKLQDAGGNASSASPSLMSESLEKAATPTPAAERGSSHLSPASKNDRRRSSSRKIEPRYEPQEEECPEGVFNAAKFQSAFGKTKAIVQSLKVALSSNASHFQSDSAILKLQEEANRLADFELASTRKVGFVGDSGAGKSSILNSLLDIKDFVRASGDGKASTCVATEFHFHKSPAFSIEVELLTENECFEQMSQLLQSYRRFYLNHLDPSHWIDAEEREDFKAKAQLAEDTFNSMFPGRVPSRKRLLEQSEDDTIRFLRSLVKDMRPTEAQICKFELSEETCVHELRILSSTAAEQDGIAPWPYIRRIKVSLNAYVLSKGLILVDLPGLKDINTARQNVTERYLRDCDDVFAVGEIGRAVTDQSIRNVLNMAKYLPDTNLGVICTKSDVIDVGEASLDWQGEKGQIVRRMQDKVDDDERLLEDLKDAVESYTDESDDLTPEEKHELEEIKGDKSRAKTQLNASKFDLRSFLIKSRNEDVSSQLKNSCKETLPDLADNLKIFCVSNTMYKENRYLPKRKSLRCLQMSGIPTLRQYCVSLVSESRYRAASKFMKVSVPAVMGLVELWLQPDSDTIDTEMKADVISALREMELHLISDLCRDNSSPVHQLSQSLRRYFSTQICDRDRVPSWTDAAKNAGHSWASLHWGTYAAVCRRFGLWQDGKRDYRWNEDAMKQMTSDTAAPWRGLRELMAAQQDAVIASLISPTDRALQFLENKLGNNRPIYVPLSQTLLTEQRALEQDTKKLFEDAEIAIGRLYTDAFSSFNTSFFGKAMESTYVKCNGENGPGSHSRRKYIMETALSQESLFSDILVKMRHSFTSIVNSLQDDLITTVTSHISRVSSALDLVRDEDIALESQSDLQFRGRVSDALQEAKRGIQSVHEQIKD